MHKFNRRSLFTLFGSTLSTGVLTKKGFGQSSLKANADYDYIIVGSGAGGGPLAVNLSHAGFKVLLLEAGTDQGDKSVYQVPALHPQSTEDSEMAWDFFVDHFSSSAKNEQDAKHVAGQGILYPRAGTLGGCTAHNAMITVYPLAKDWDQLAEDIGDETYNAETMRKYFALLENAEYTDSPDRKAGWLPINLPLTPPAQLLGESAIIALLFSAWRKFRKDGPNSDSAIGSLLKLIRNSDVNAEAYATERPEGLIMIPTAITSEGKRYSTRDHLLANQNTNLTIRTSALVSRVLFDESGETPEAIGVEYIVGDKIYQASKSPNPSQAKKTNVYAKHEVILAGGTFNTPQILMNSGVGPENELKRFEDSRYKVILNREGVGRNLQDRYEVGIVSEAKYGVGLADGCTFKGDVNDPCYKEWQSGDGPYSSSGGIIGFFKKSKQTVTEPDLFIFLVPSDFHGYFPGYSNVIASSRDKLTWAVLKSHTDNHAGTVTLNDTNPLSKPIINFKYYEEGSNPESKDLEAMLDGIEFVRTINSNATNTLDIFDISAGLPEGASGFEYPNIAEAIPGPDYKKRDKLREWVRRNSWGHHACGTCKMGKETDPLAVVNSKFEVIGTKSLRIVDASVFPRIPGYFIASSIYTMSERATDEILQTRGVQRRVEV
ncbi:MAG: GMC family oxidoreductase [Proteobacteria bacterium]|nr:MAG: GMC family oxidoreductase [Pseudomonadota bacterium]